jgi:uncharacterized membrane protein YfcA
MLGELTMDWWFVASAIGAMGIASFVQGFTGFGGGIVAVSLLSLLYTVLEATALTNVCAVALTCGILWQLRRHVAWRMVWPLLAGQACTLPLGVWFLSSADDELARRVMGVLVIGFAGLSLLGRNRRLGGPLRPAPAVGVGATSGVMNGAFCMGGPPLIAYIYSRDMSRDALKATIQVCFVFNSVYRLAVAGGVGHITVPTLISAAFVLPAILIASGAGMALSRRVSTEPFRRMAWVVFAVLGAVLCVR